MDARQREQLQLAMAALAGGDRSAYHPVFTGLWPVLRRFSERMLHDRDLAQDAAQTALLKLLLHATEFRPDRDVVAWALGFASFECLSVRNRSARHREQREDAVLAAVVAGHPSPEEATIETDLRAAAVEVLGAPAPGCRDDRPRSLRSPTGQLARLPEASAARPGATPRRLETHPWLP